MIRFEIKIFAIFEAVLSRKGLGHRRKEDYFRSSFRVLKPCLAISATV